MKGGKIEREESSKSKSPSKSVKYKTSGEDKKASKGKRQYIANITGREPQANRQSKGAMKRKIIKMMVVNKKRWRYVDKNP